MFLQPLASEGAASPSFPLIGVHLEVGPEDQVGNAGASSGHTGEQVRGQSGGRGGCIVGVRLSTALQNTASHGYARLVQSGREQTQTGHSL